ncbi:MAG: hypothetical protein ABSE54_11070 [Smithella sp.]|jgi:hypothetical protein
MHLKEVTFHSGQYPARDCYPFNLQLLLTCPEAIIYTFDNSPIRRIKYEQTDHYLVYRDFMVDRNKYLKQNG